MNKFFSNEDKKVESFQKSGNDQNIFFGSKKGKILPNQGEPVKKVKGELARYEEPPKKEDNFDKKTPAKFFDNNEQKPIIYEKPDFTNQPIVEQPQQVVNQSIQQAIMNDMAINANKKEIIEFNNVVKKYLNGEVETTALNGVSFKIYEGEVVIFLGTSGAGKSTALNLLGGLDKATSGSIIVDGVDITKYSDSKLLKYRREKIGFIFQFYNLIQTLNAKDNVDLVLELCKDKKYDSTYLLEQVGLGHRIHNFPSQMSGGEQQRVSIARALAKNPRILFADEPTGALDYNTTRQVLELLIRICKENNITLIIVTHNNFITPIADVVYSFRSGEIVSIERNNNPSKVEDLPW